MMTVNSYRLFYMVLVAVLGFSANAHSGTVLAANCSQPAVAAAVAAALNGDTVVIPAGTCQWTIGLTIGKAITLRGQGIGSTIIQDGVPSAALMTWTLVPNLASRLTGIEFRNNGRTAPNTNGIIFVYGSNTDGRTMRVDNCLFDHLNGIALSLDTVIGVVDHNTYLGTPTNRFINVWGKSWDGGTWGDKAWTASTGWGSANFLFIETNTMTYDVGTHYALVDAFGGARFVLRYNTVTRGWVEAHGTDSTNRYRSTRAIEIYGNTFTAADASAYIVNIRGGTALIHDNTAAGYQTTPRFELANYRNSTSFAIWGIANGTNPWDNNSGGKVLVQALDQPCTSRGSLISGDFPTPPWPAGQNNQVDDPCYEWNNTEDGSDVDFEAGHPTIRVNEHFFQDTQAPGYIPYPYPHPLSIPGIAPSPPQNLRITG